MIARKTLKPERIVIVVNQLEEGGTA